MSTATIVAEYPHDPGAFTQGLTIHNGRLLEGTGQYGRSGLREVELATGEVQRMVPLNRAFFGEGIAVAGDHIYQLTWQRGVGAIYDIDTFEFAGVFEYEGEGWGLTFDGEALILSDGTSRIRFLDPNDFSVVREITVTGMQGPIERINELEFIDGQIWANVWYEDIILRIDPADGSVDGIVDISSLYPRAQRSSEAVANGIAWDADSRRLFVTGKNWPRLFEIELVPADE